MTREEAIIIDMAIKILEQESVLDKIRTEMEDILIIHQDKERIYQQLEATIDKHTAESEG